MAYELYLSKALSVLKSSSFCPFGVKILGESTERYRLFFAPTPTHLTHEKSVT